MDETLGHFTDYQYLPRPGVFEFITEMSLHYELVLFTSATEKYANIAMNILDPNHLIKLRLYRQHATIHNNRLVKDLETLGRDITKTIIIDNDPLNFRSQPDNGICIKT